MSPSLAFFRATFCAVAFALALLSPLAAAKSPVVDLVLADGTQVWTSNGQTTFRIGNAALVRVYSYNPTRRQFYFNLVLLSCSGSWISSSIQWGVESKETFERDEADSISSRFEDGIPTDAIKLLTAPEANTWFARPLLAMASAICKSASPEPRNILVPIASTRSESPDWLSTALLSGTATLRGATLEVWTRTSSAQDLPALDEFGKQVMFGNEPLRVTKLTGKYTLNRKLLQCVTRTASIAESVFYQGSSEAPQIVSIPVEDIKFKAVIPGSIGELILDRVCGLYANKSR